ncbi:MAG: hypothetical protein A2293_10280 [Elusimicrobia bacterium RIFOXYB2_FULL_49_7]|nr:MAG: hypothetical protein A2293_10280 [Elusimicrobia bacterium RIFOXYB2_FULL_49_7]
MKILNLLRSLSLSKRRFFKIPKTASALHVEGDAISFIKLSHSESVETIAEIHERGLDLAAFVKKHGLYHEAVTLVPEETELFNRIVDKEEIGDGAYDNLMASFLPRGMDAEAATLDNLSLPSGRHFLSFIRHSAEERLHSEAKMNGLYVERIGSGISEIGFALSKSLPDYTGAVLVVKRLKSLIIILEKGVLAEHEVIHVGAAHFLESLEYYHSEISKFLSLYWETKLFKERLKSVVVIAEEPAIATSFQEAGYEVKQLEGFTPENALIKSMAMNSLLYSDLVIDHLPQIEPELKQVRVADFVSERLLRFVLPAAAALLILALTVFAVFQGLSHRFEKKMVAKHKLINHLSALIHENDKLAKDLAAAEGLNANQVSVSSVMEGVAKGLPEQVWLREFRLIQEDKAKLFIEGVSQNEGGVPKTLSGFDNIKSLREVRLSYTQKLDKKELDRFGGGRFVGLTRFGLECTTGDK